MPKTFKIHAALEQRGQISGVIFCPIVNDRKNSLATLSFTFSAACAAVLQLL